MRAPLRPWPALPRARAWRAGATPRAPRRRRLLPAATVVAAWAVVSACSGTAPHHPSASPSGGRGTAAAPGTPHHHLARVRVPGTSAACHPGISGAEWWIVSQRELAVLASAAPSALRHAIKPADLLVLGPAGSTTRTGQAVADFKSYAGFRGAVQAGVIPRTTHWVLYDNERWPQTPVNEQQHPGRYERLFTSLAHRHGFKVILAPGQDLVQAFSPGAFRATTAAWRRYLSLGLAGTSARLADIYEVQAQAFELSFYRPQHIFRRDVRAAVAQARAASPGTTVFVGISTRRAATARELLSDYLATRGLAAGFWLNVPGAGDPRQQLLAEQFLRRLPAVAGGGPSCLRRPAGPRAPSP
jgi:hypothetical protein